MPTDGNITKCNEPQLTAPERSDWKCELFGSGTGIVLNPRKGQEPNWFHRWMQRLLVGNKWRKVKR